MESSAPGKPTEAPRFDFPKSRRILKRGDFLRLARTGRRLGNADFILCVAPGRNGAVRLGITVTRKVGGAVERNRIKRLCREFFRLHRHRIPADSDILLIAKRQAAVSDNETLRRSLARLFRHLTG